MRTRSGSAKKAQLSSSPACHLSTSLIFEKPTVQWRRWRYFLFDACLGPTTCLNFALLATAVSACCFTKRLAGTVKVDDLIGGVSETLGEVLGLGKLVSLIVQ